ncbi:MAG: deoxyguanosinetriphosphate triphosphohydrolase [candidate division WOR-3 bacterium]|nr:deoxyguanosinetriphosphate triphosphohydrolase [candidate division WOR-3 bacterium]
MKNLREQLEEIERQTLAPYAILSGESKGRVHKELPPEYRTHFMRDRDRIIHATAFRRLEYKTQVFVNHEGDYYRTRLTHALEVQQIARTIARALSLNESLTEAISLAHDIGHTPFGHAGESELNELMQGFGGFEHNVQGLRVVDYLEHQYSNFRGLNLCYETREGIIKHETEYDSVSHINSEFNANLSPSLEAQIVNVADEIAYNAHDLDDGLKSKYLDLNQLKNVEIWSYVFDKTDSNLNDQGRIYTAIREFINLETSDVIENSHKFIQENEIESLQDVYSHLPLIQFSSRLKSLNRKLKDFLRKNLYRHYKVVKMQEKAKRLVDALFSIYIKKADQLPPQFQEMLPESGKERVVCDYIAGMTDRFAQDEYERLFLPFRKM